MGKDPLAWLAKRVPVYTTNSKCNYECCLPPCCLCERGTNQNSTLGFTTGDSHRFTIMTVCSARVRPSNPGAYVVWCPAHVGTRSNYALVI